MSKPTPSQQNDGRHGSGMQSTGPSTLRAQQNLADPRPHTLADFRRAEGRETRKQRLRELWESLSQQQQQQQPYPERRVEHENEHHHDQVLTPEKAKSLKNMYDSELVGRCKEDPSSSRPSRITWDEFKKYAEAKEVGTCHSLSTPLVRPIPTAT